MDKMWKNRLRWFGDVTRREEPEAVRTVMEMNIGGRRGSPKNKWLNGIGTRTVGVCVNDVDDRAKWRTRVADPKIAGRIRRGKKDNNNPVGSVPRMLATGW